MEWLTQNWIWLIAIAGIMFVMFRGRHGGMMGGGCGGMAHEPPVPRDKTEHGGHSVPPPAKQNAAEQPAAQGTPEATKPIAGSTPNAPARHRHGGCC